MEYAVTTMVVAFLGPWDFLIILAVIVFVFGTARFGRTLRALKWGGKEFKRGVRGEDELPPPPPSNSS
jgi:Sec-independent protein translocase protein TatA